MIKKIISIFACAILAAGIFSGCGSSDDESSTAKIPDDVEIVNFTAPVDGEKIAVMNVKDFGTVKIKLFPEYAPKGVENFEGLADMGYYNELIFHRIEKNFVIQGGDPKGNGTGGNSIWGTEFEIEASENLYHFTGAVAYAHATSGTNGSQFYIITSQATALTDETIDANLNGKVIPNNVREKYKEVGGQPYLDGDYTVFGQVFEGQDIVDKIAEVEVDSNSKPIDQVPIENIEIVEYKD